MGSHRVHRRSAKMSETNGAEEPTVSSAMAGRCEGLGPAIRQVGPLTAQEDVEEVAEAHLAEFDGT